MGTLGPLPVERFEEAWQLLLDAFGADPGGRQRLLARLPHIHAYGLVERDRLAAVAIVLPYEQWFGGARVPMAGIADVAVAPEARGGGTGRALLADLLPRLRERGALVSALFPTVLGLYRAAGWELAGQIAWLRLDAAALRTRSAVGRAAAHDPPAVRRATAKDGPALLDGYRRLAAAANGLIDRDGPLFDAPPVDHTTLVEQDGQVVGHLSWRRGQGYGEGAELTVWDLVGDTAEAYRALFDQLGAWSTVTPTIRLRVPADEAVPLLLPTPGIPVGTPHPWMFRLVDAGGAIAAKGWPTDADLAVEFTVLDDLAPWHAGPRRLEVGGGEARLTAGGGAGPTIDQRGLALLYAGGVRTAALRRAGLLTGDATGDAALDEAFAGPRPALLDSF